MLHYKDLEDLIAIDSPSGFTAEASKWLFAKLLEFGFHPEFTTKGALKCSLGKEAKIGLAAHVDTLGAIVTSLNGNGTLGVSPIGSPQLNSYEGEYCRIYMIDGSTIEGTLLMNNPASHVNNQLSITKREHKKMHIRIDNEAKNVDALRKIGLDIGDFVCFDPRYQHSDSGYIKSRFLDNKAGCFVLLEVARYFAEKKQAVPVELFFSTYEEVGHGGAAGFSETIEELLVIDMGVVGDKQAGSEQKCSICAKDSSGPYDYEMRQKLVKLARENKIDAIQDVYPYYGSDGSAALQAGWDFRVALIGPGVSASHGNERTHEKALVATRDLCIAMIDSI